MGSTGAARIRLRMKSPVPWIMIFPEAFGTHHEACHGSVRTVVGNGPRYGISGAAVRAVDEGIAVSPVVGIKHFPQTVVADRDIRRNQGERLFPARVRAFA